MLASAKTMSTAVRAVLWMSGAVLSFSTMAIAVRELKPMGPFEILFWRTAISFLIVLAFLPRTGVATVRTRRFGLHFLRNAVHFGGQYCWVYAIGALSLATVFAIEFTMPVWTAILAALILHERLTRPRLIMLVLGLIGVLIILRPGALPVEFAAFVMLLGSLCYAAQFIATKRLASTESAIAVLFWMSVIQTPVAFVLALPHWVHPSGMQVFWVIAIGCFSFFAHYCITRSLKIGDATLVIPIDFLRLPFIAVVGALLYAEPFDPMVFVGAVVIFSGTYYSLSRESRR
jgi:drug/metabolite transporter (DMT)-like permease